MTTIERKEYHRDLMRRVRAQEPKNVPEYGVTKRNVAPWEPAWTVYRSKGGSEAVAQFYDQQDAQKYADWRNKACNSL